MITTTHLVMVRVYLKQELPPPYNELIEVEDDKIIIILPENGQPFNVNYDHVFGMINQRVKEIRDRQYELNFTVRSQNQLRDFTILK
jgi:hypothetical protein